jgi:diacylglycerol kinase (ATP)
MARGITFVVNPAAGQGNGLAAAREAGKRLDDAGVAHRLWPSTRMEHAATLAEAAAKQGDVVAAVGGDGLVSRLASVMVQVGGILGVVPTGRGNDIARGLGIPMKTSEATEVLLNGGARRVDLLRVTGRHGLSRFVAGNMYAGMDSLTTARAESIRLLRGQAQYRYAALRELTTWRPVRYKLDIDGDLYAYDGFACVIASSPYYGAGMPIAPAAVVDDGFADIVMVAHGSKLKMVMGLADLVDGTHVDRPEVTTLRGRSITLEMDRDLPVYADGDPLPLEPPLQIVVVPGALRALVPRTAAA